MVACGTINNAALQIIYYITITRRYFVFTEMVVKWHQS